MTHQTLHVHLRQLGRGRVFVLLFGQLIRRPSKRELLLVRLVQREHFLRAHHPLINAVWLCDDMCLF